MFGTQFQFNTFKEEKFKTITGGIITLICIATILLFTFLFGRDFFFRTNPVFFKQERVPQEYPEPITLTNENMKIAWRLSDTYSREVNFTGLLNVRIEHNSWNTTTEWNMQNLKLKRCSELPGFDELKNVIKLEDWFCIDWSENNLRLGGNYDHL